MADLGFVIDWYAAQCDGDWENVHGIRISTLGNPGWQFSVDIDDTALEGRTLAFKFDRSDDDWLNCRCDGHTFDVACGPRNLSEAVAAFAELAGRADLG